MNLDSKETPRLKQALFELNRGGISKYYKFDVNQTISMKNLKKMIVAAANISKQGLKFFHKGEEYTDYDDFNMLELFPDTQMVEFEVRVPMCLEEEPQSIELKFGAYCESHNYKYPYFYCYDCKKSICSICQNNGHKTHNYIEKYDYLQSSRNLVDSIFQGVKDTLDEPNPELKSVQTLRDRIKLEFFPQLFEMLNKLETKLLEVSDFFCENEKLSSSNMQQNVSLMKNHCSEGLDKLKSEINIEDMMVNEDIFLTFDKKFKEIASEKIRVFNDTRKFEELKKAESSITHFVENMYKELFETINKWLQIGTFNELKSIIAGNSVNLVSRDEIITKLLSDVKIKTLQSHSKYVDTPSKNNLSFPSVSGGVNKLLSFPSETREESKKEIPLLVPSLLAEESRHPIRELKGVVVSRCIPDTKEVMFFRDFDKVFTVPVEFNRFLDIEHFLPQCASINVAGKLYISGGLTTKNEASSSFLIFDPNNETLVGLPDLPTPRYSHSMICHNGFIYFVGGNTQVVEKYEIASQKFTKLCPLQVVERKYPILYVHNNFLYAFFGKSKDAYIDSIEKVNLKNQKSKWEYVMYKTSGSDINLKMYGAGILPSGEGQILFCGGKTANGVSQACINYDFANFIFKPWPSARFEEGMYFGESVLIDLEDGNFGHFNINKKDNFFKASIE